MPAVLGFAIPNCEATKNLNLKELQRDLKSVKKVHQVETKKIRMTKEEYEARAKKFAKKNQDLYDTEVAQKVSWDKGREVSEKEGKKIDTAAKVLLSAKDKRKYEKNQPLYIHPALIEFPMPNAPVITPELKFRPSHAEAGLTVQQHYGVEFVRPWPTKKPPRSLPKGAHPNAAKINALLEQSINFQSSKAKFMKPYINFNNSFHSNGLIWYYLRCLNLVQDHELELVYGIQLWPELWPSDDGFAHFWLEINGHIVDNMNINDFERPYVKRTFDDYVKACPIETSLNIIKDRQGTYPKFNQVYATRPDLIEKALVTKFNPGVEHLNTLTIRIFDDLLREHAWNEYKIDIPDVEEKWAKQCWTCFKVIYNKNVDNKLISLMLTLSF